jgi:hypothetical protein
MTGIGFSLPSSSASTRFPHFGQRRYSAIAGETTRGSTRASTQVPLYRAPSISRVVASATSGLRSGSRMNGTRRRTVGARRRSSRSFRVSSRPSPVRVTPRPAERRKVARPRRSNQPSARLRFHNRSFHSFHSEVGNEFWTRVMPLDRRLRLSPSSQANSSPRSCAPTAPAS